MGNRATIGSKCSHVNVFDTGEPLSSFSEYDAVMFVFNTAIRSTFNHLMLYERSLPPNCLIATVGTIRDVYPVVQRFAKPVSSKPTF